MNNQTSIFPIRHAYHGHHATARYTPAFSKGRTRISATLSPAELRRIIIQQLG